MIRERSPGRWQVVVYAGNDANGRERRIRRTIVGTKTDAIHLERRIHIELGDGAIPTTSVTLSDLLDQWLSMVESDLSPTTVRSYRGYIERNIRPNLGNVAIATLTTAQLDAFYGKLRSNLAPATIRQVHAIIHRAMNQALRWGWIKSNPATACQPPRIRRAEVQPPSIEDVRKLLDAAVEDDPDFATFIWLAATTGARRGELCALRWNDIDLELGSLMISSALIEVNGEVLRKDPKTHRARHIALDDATVQVLLTHQARARARTSAANGVLTNDMPVFVADLDGTPIVPMKMTTRFGRLAKRVGVRCRLHDLRHWHVTQLLAGGISVRDTAGRVGHASAAMTLDVYGHAVPAADRIAAETVGRVLLPPS